MNQVNNKGPSDSFRQLGVEEAPVPQAGWRTHLQKRSSYWTPIHGTCTSSHCPVPLPSSTPHTCSSSWHTSTGAGWILLPKDDAGTTALGHLLCRASSALLLVALVGLAQVQGDPEAQQGEQPADGNTGSVARVGTSTSRDRRKRAFLLPPPHPAGNTGKWWLL